MSFGENALCSLLPLLLLSALEAALNLAYPPLRDTMLEPLRDVLQKKRIILASKAENRRVALENIGLNVELIPSDADETLDENAHPPEEYVKIIATRKVDAVKELLKKKGEKYDLIIGADTVVSVDGRIYLKPTSEQDAYQKLRSLSGRSNVVYTGVALKQPGRPIEAFADATEVFFGKMTDEQIWAYIRTGEPMNVAGGYKIQGLGGTFIEKVEGNYFNVLGLPVYKFCRRICEYFPIP